MIGYWMIIIRRCRRHRPMDSIISCSCRSWQRKIQSWKVCVSYISTKNAECTWPGFPSVLESLRIVFVKFSSKAWKVVQQNSAVLSTLWILFWQDQITRLWPLSLGQLAHWLSSSFLATTAKGVDLLSIMQQTWWLWQWDGLLSSCDYLYVAKTNPNCVSNDGALYWQGCSFS